MKFVKGINPFYLLKVFTHNLIFFCFITYIPGFPEDFLVRTTYWSMFYYPGDFFVAEIFFAPQHILTFVYTCTS